MRLHARQTTLVAPDFLFTKKFTVIRLWVVLSLVPSLLIFCYWATLFDLIHHTTTICDEVSQTAFTDVITKSMDEGFFCQYCAYCSALGVPKSHPELCVSGGACCKCILQEIEHPKSVSIIVGKKASIWHKPIMQDLDEN